MWRSRARWPVGSTTCSAAIRSSSRRRSRRCDGFARQARERYQSLRRGFQEGGDSAGLDEARAAVRAAPMSRDEQQLLLAWLAGEHHHLLPAPDVLLTPTPKVPGLDGRKMSKSYAQHHRSH